MKKAPAESNLLSAGALVYPASSSCTIFSNSSQVGEMASMSPQVSNLSSMRAQVMYQNLY